MSKPGKSIRADPRGPKTELPMLQHRANFGCNSFFSSKLQFSSDKSNFLFLDWMFDLADYIVIVKAILQYSNKTE